VPLWLVIAGLGVTQVVGWGTAFFIIGTVSPDIAASTGWPQTLIFGAFTAALCTGGVIARWAGRLIDTHGGRHLVPLGSLLLAAGCALIGLWPTKTGYVGGWLMIGIAMRFATYDPVFAALTQISRDNARRSISALTLMGGLSSTVFWPLNHALSQQVGWQNTFLIHAGFHLILCLPLHLLILRDARPLPADLDAAREDVHLSGRDRSLAIALFAAALSLNGLVFSALSAHVMPLFKGIGLTAAQAVLVSSIIGPAQVASRLGEMLLGRNLHPAKLGLYAFAMVPISFGVLLADGFSLWAALAFALIYGASNGVITIARGVVPLALFGRRGYSEVLGVIGAPNLAMSATAPLLFAWVLGFASATQAMMMLGIASLLSSLAMGRLYLLQRR
jgi:hypothetical protein